MGKAPEEEEKQRVTTTGISQAAVGARKGEMTADGGIKRRKLENHQILSSSSYLQLRSRTLVIMPSEKEKKTKRRLTEVEELVNYAEEEVVNVVYVERNKVLSGCSSDSPGEFERGEVEDEGEGLLSRAEHAKAGGGGEEEETEDGCFESTSCNQNIEDHRRTEEETLLSELRGDVDGEDEELGNLESTAGSGAYGSLDRRLTDGKTTNITNLSAKMPSEEEIEGFFAAAETEQRKNFMDKYNYDVVNDVPVEGRYQWVKAETMK